MLAEKNEQTLKLVESCAFVYSLDTENPKVRPHETTVCVTVSGLHTSNKNNKKKTSIAPVPLETNKQTNKLLCMQYGYV